MSHPSHHSKIIRVYILLIITVLIWGLSWPICKIGLRSMPAIWFAATRAGIGAVSMFIIVILSKKFIIPSKCDLPILAVMGFVQVAMFMTLITVGLHYVSAGRSAILVYTTPLWVMPVAIFFFKEKATPLKWVGFVLGVFGIVILFGPWEMDWTNHDVILGNALLMLAALCWAFCMLCARHMQWHHAPFELISWQLLLGAIPILMVALLRQPHVVVEWNYELVFSLLYAGVLGTAVAYWGTMVVSKELPNVTSSLSFLAVPVSGLLFSALIINESITISMWVAMLFILSGLLCVALSKSN